MVVAALLSLGRAGRALNLPQAAADFRLEELRRILFHHAEKALRLLDRERPCPLPFDNSLFVATR